MGANGRDFCRATLHHSSSTAICLVKSTQHPRSLRWIVILHHDRDLTILNVRWTPEMAAYPHDHRMWPLIGLYGGREDNRSPEGLQVAGGTQLETGKSGGSPKCARASRK